jgi:hypothetical protein
MSELVALPVSINNAPEKEMSCGSTCGKMAHKPCKKQQKDCNDTSYCLNCPLCYTMTMPVTAASVKPPAAVKKEYPAYQSNYLFIYYSTVWRPPNGC